MVPIYKDTQTWTPKQRCDQVLASSKLRRPNMSVHINYEEPCMAEAADRGLQAMGADVIAGLLYVHCGKPLKDLHLLDAGCCSGMHTKALIDLGVGKVTLLDASSEMLKVAEEKLKAATECDVIDKVIKAQIPPFPFHDRIYDAVMFNYVLHHFDRTEDNKGFPAMETMLHDTKRILRPKGVLVVTTMLPSVLKEAIWYTKLHRGLGEKLAKYFPSTEQFLDTFTKCGFQCVSAMNFLRMNNSTAIVGYRDPEGPLKEEWRKGTFMYAAENDTEMKEMLKELRELKGKESLKQFMIDNDRTSELGMTTLFVCISL